MDAERLGCGLEWDKKSTDVFFVEVALFVSLEDQGFQRTPQQGTFEAGAPNAGSEFAPLDGVRRSPRYGRHDSRARSAVLRRCRRQTKLHLHAGDATRLSCLMNDVL